MNTPWRIELLGGLQARQQERLLTHFVTRKTAALLAYLALFPHRAHTREELAERLWPGEDPEAIRNRLKQALFALRHSMEAVDSPSESLLLAGRVEVRLNPHAFITDVAEFEAALHAAFQPETQAAQAPLLEKAVSLYAGELLPGYYEEWIVAERERLAEAYRSALSRLALAKAKTGDLVGAIAAAQKAVEADPLREASHYDLMRLLVAAKRPSEALRQYKHLEQILKQELGTTPSRPVLNMMEQVQAAQTSGSSKAMSAHSRDASGLERAPSETALPTNLQMPLSSFIGREAEIQQIEQRMQESRLVTLTGAGGVGKTRLALQVASHLQQSFSEGAWMVELAPLTDPGLVAQVLAQTLGIAEEPGQPLVKSVCAALADKTLLVILDNCEHLIDACASLAETLLMACPHLRILATSREGLGIAGEMAFRVPYLSLPEAGQKVALESLLQYEAVRLFVERARFHQPAFVLTEANAPALASTCQRLDGLPLAIELAAARVKAMPVEQIARRLDDRFALLTSGSRTALPRQQTLRALLDWSYQLLSAKERMILGRLSVFAGGFSLEAAEAVCGADAGVGRSEGSTLGVGENTSAPPSGQVTEESHKREIGFPNAQRLTPNAYEVLDLLRSLVDKSLALYEEQAGEGRYRMLETIRQYAQQRLAETEEMATLRSRHRDYFLRLAETGGSKLIGSEQGMWFERLETEYDNLRSALDWCKTEEDGVEAALRLCGSLWRFWIVRGHLSEGRAYLEEALQRQGAAERTLVRAKALNVTGALTSQQGDYKAAKALYQESLAIYQELDDKRGIASTLNNLGLAAWHQGDYETARVMYEKCLPIVREFEDRTGLSMLLNNLGNVAFVQGDYTAATALHEESLALKRASGDKRGIAVSLCSLGNVNHMQGDYAAARILYEESLAIYKELSDKSGIALALNNLGDVAREQGDYEAAWTLLTESLVIRRELGDKWGITFLLRVFARLAVGTDHPEQAVRLWGAEEALREAIGSSLLPNEWEAYDGNRNAVRETLGEKTFAAMWTAGRALSLEQVIAYALEVAGSSPPE